MLYRCPRPRHRPARMQTPSGGVRVAAAAGSALQPLAVVLLEADSLAALAASRAGDWQVVESSATQVRLRPSP